MTEKRPIVLIAFVAGILLLAGNMFVQSRLDNSIRENKLIDEQFVEGAPPMVAFTTVALGGFRGLIADFLWLRAISMQEQGKYFEMVQLASWIMKLQPKSTATAAYLAWNMAYNISVTYSSPADRWRWVNKGIDLYHEALLYNPNDPVLYKELGWIYQHKLGNILDDAQRYYKYQMALRMITILGKHYPDWKELAEAPATEAGLKAALKTESTFFSEMKDAGYDSLDQLSEAFREAEGVFPEKLAVKMKNKDEVRLITNYLRVRWLRDATMLTPSDILRVNEKYGDLDWVLPESFAIYWAMLGIEKSPDRKSVDCSRMITQSLQVTFTNGRMLFPGDKPAENFLLIPNFSVADAVRQSYLDAIQENPDIKSFRDAYENFMSRAITTMYSYGQYTKAQEFYDYLTDHKKNRNTRLPFDQFVLKHWQEEIKDAGFKQANDMINGLIFRSCVLLGYGDKTAADAHLQLARMAYNRYMKDMGTESRTALPPFSQMTSEIAQACIRSLPGEIADRIKAQLLLEAQQAPAENKAENKAETAPAN